MIARLGWIIAMLLLCDAIHAQELVVNGGFEEENICIEYEQTCSPAGWRNAAHLPFGYQAPAVPAYSGRHYLPMVVEDKGVTNFRIYWFTRLKCPMQKGAVYNITFYAGALGSKFIPYNLAIYFSATEVKQVRVQPLRQQPSVAFTDKNVTKIKKSEWLKVTAQYTATGDERYLVIGNFHIDADMIRHKRPNRQKVTYCVDELSVKKQGDSMACAPDEEVTAWLAYRIRHTPGFYEPPVVKKETPAPVPEVKQPQRIDTLVLQDVLFKFDSGNLTPAASQVLDTIITKLKQTPFKAIRIEGHTDSLGTEAYNIDLSTRRANAVLEYLTANGLNGKPASASGKGELRPVAANSTEEGRRRNRRVEILIEY